MLKKRIIPCLDIKNGRAVKGIQFQDLRDAGDAVELAKKYSEQGADELVFLDISASQEERRTVVDLVLKIAQEINIPFTVGGGIKSVEDARRLINSGADKISVNSAAVYRPELINELAIEFGSQCVCVAIDSKVINGVDMVFTHGGKKITEWETLDWAMEAERRGAGEILLTSMNNDGEQAGFALRLTNAVATAVNLPVIASGGAGKTTDFAQLFDQTKASAGLAASIFHYNTLPIAELKAKLKAQKINVR